MDSAGTRCIVLRTLQYSDKYSIVRLLTREGGVVSAMTPAGHSAESNRRRALLMPLGVVECVFSGRRKGNSDGMEWLKSVSRAEAGDFRANHLKNISALFIADVLHSLLTPGQGDESLFDFICDSMEYFASVTDSRAIANFHIAFLVNLQQYMGIAPDLTTYRPGTTFDMSAGMFRHSRPAQGEYLSVEESAIAFYIGRMTYRNSSLFNLSRKERNRVLNIILRYYSLHLRDLSSLPSLEVVRALF